jgi:divalent metal cation (Fe/Co/Zn/Cd) transporter
VGWALYAVAAYIVVSAAWSLITRNHPSQSLLGIAIAAAALVVMPGLWRWRLGLAERLGSPALKGDAAESAICWWMAAPTLAGVLLSRFLGWWWADAVAGLALIWWIRGEADEALEAARTGRRGEHG